MNEQDVDHGLSLTRPCRTGDDVHVAHAQSPTADKTGPSVDSPDQVGRRLLIGATVLLAILVVGYLLLVCTAWGHNLDNEAYFGRDVDGRAIVRGEGDFLGHVTAGVLAASLLLLVLIGVIRRVVVVGLIAAAGAVVAVAGAEAWKHLLPWEHLISTDYSLPRGLQEETYPSGHTTIGTSLALALLILIPHVWRWWASVAAVFMILLFGLGVVFAGWHRPADAVGGVCWGGLVMSVAALFALRWRADPDTAEGANRRASDHLKLSIVLSMTLGIVTYTLVVAAAMFGPSGLPDADRAFLLGAFLIVASAVTVPSWFGNVLANVRWSTAARL